MTLNQRAFFIVVMMLLSVLYIVPWEKYGIDNAFLNKRYTLWLDLQWGVELDYKVDLDTIKTQTGIEYTSMRNIVIEDIKKTIDTRVKSLGLSEPNIQDAKYGNDSHIIVQIPTQSYANLSQEEREEKNAQDIARAKEVIWKVVKLEFREEKTQLTEADKTARKNLAKKADEELKTTPFSTVWQKYRDNYENVIFYAGTGVLPPYAQFPDHESIETFPYRAPMFEAKTNPTMADDGSGNVITKTDKGYSFVELYGKTGQGTGAIYNYSFLYIDERPSLWQAAKTSDGKILNDAYLVSAGNTPNMQTWAPQVTLLFNSEWKNIFKEITQKLIGKQLAIFVGSDMVMNAQVNEVIPSGEAVISGTYTHAETKSLANKINAWKVAAPIYLTSERTIDAKIGINSLSQIVKAGLIGLFIIVIFLVYFYHIGGLLAGIALIAYSLLLVAFIKVSGATMTLASIAWAILSIGLAIDANILIFERMREALQDGYSIEKAIKIGFNKSWTAIWDSHITSLASALILFWFGISMIKWFGFMLGLWIILSLFTAMWVSRILILWTSKKLKNNAYLLIGYKK